MRYWSFHELHCYRSIIGLDCAILRRRSSCGYPSFTFVGWQGGPLCAHSVVVMVLRAMYRDTMIVSKTLLCTIMVHDMVAKREVGLAKKGLCNGEFAFPPILFLLLRCSCCSCLGLVYTDGIAGLSIRTGVLGGLSG